MKFLFSHLIRTLSLLALTLLSVNAFADNFYATVSKNRVVQNEVFQLEVTTDGKASSGDLDFSVLKKDFVMGQPSFSTSVSIINGARSATAQWTVSLAAKHTGIITIPSFTLNGDKTQAIALQVQKDTNAPATKDLVEVTSHLDKTTLYPKEAALLKARLIVKTDPRRLQSTNIEPPKVDGMELKSTGEPKQYQAVLNGLQVTVVDQNFRITATKPGTFSLSEPKFEGSILYGNDYNGSTRIVSVETTPKTYQIHVQPQPKDYKGVWLPTSHLSLKQRWTDGQGNPIIQDTFKTKVGDSLNREITLEVSSVSQNELPDIIINNPVGVRTYAEKPHFKTQDNGDVVMTLKQVVIPSKTGNLELPSVSLNWWNSTAKREQTAKLSGLTLSVAPSDNAQPLPAVNPAPSAPAQVKVVTKQDAGFWPYLTGLFVVLWLATLGLAFYWKRTTPVAKQVDDKPTQVSAQSLTLEQAIAAKNGIAISQALSQWRQTVTLTSEEEAELTLEKNALDQALYSNQGSDLDGKALLALIRRIEKRMKKKSKISKDDSTLPPL